MTANDLDLLRQFTRKNSEAAFSKLVRRHLGLVYSAALRQVRSPQLAEEVAQSAFTDLARHAHRLAPDTILTAWLYQVTRRTAIDVVRREARRQLREQIATEMNTMNATTADWMHIEPLLDEAMSALEETGHAPVDCPRELLPVLKAYMDANNHTTPLDFDEYKPYITTPEQQAALDKFIKAVTE